ncbi:hypothetical protein [Mesomycoplasma ovipneumoniae]|uniref:hypothetical protein n=1 Tax=Mesomycoplasma ovipneumoniae TaxID=29562 RepID=UPI0028A6DC7A|nr:hypothetical protein [Mesomycoplasma ovipneumoniae]WNM16719.1 hypothetical protein RNM19_01070 [Mesomycoplasma ovipneumoniae]
MEKIKNFKRKIKFLTLQTGLFASVPVIFVACTDSEIPEISIQNIQSKSVELLLNNIALTPQDNIAKTFKVELRKENTENYEQVKFSAFRALHDNKPKILLKINNLDAKTKYVVRITRINGQEEEQLFVRGNVFQTNPNPTIIPGSFQKLDATDPSSQYDFKVAISDTTLNSQPIDVQYRKANALRSNPETQTFTHNLRSDQSLHVSLKNLERDTTYIISGLYDQKGNMLSFDENLFPLTFRTDGDIVGVEVSNSKFPGQIHSDLQNIDVDFKVKFSRGIVNANTVNNYNLVFKRENTGVQTGFDQINNRDIEYLANYVRPVENEDNTFIFRVKLPWRSQNNFYKIVGGYNKLFTDSHIFDQNLVDSPNILKINPAILDQKFQIDT